MKNILLFAQIIVSITLIITILLQSKGSGIGAVFGGSESLYRSKRGVEKFMVVFTIILAILFLVLAISQILLK